MTRKKKIVGLGEILWDIFPERTCLGGAPANFAYIANLLGDDGIVASRIGTDARGREALQRMKRLGLNVDHVQTDRLHPTGTVNVKIDGAGVASYEIASPAAWDFLEWTRDWQDLAARADAVCFGSLAQRAEQSRMTIRQFLRAASPHAVRIFDVNLRQSYYSADTISESMKLAEIVKLNDEELPKIMTLCRLLHEDALSSAKRLLSAYSLKLVSVTRGRRGSLLVRGHEVNGKDVTERDVSEHDVIEYEVSEHPGFEVRVADTVGSGDAFSAGLVHEYLNAAPLDRMNEMANRVGAWVASEVGAMPTPNQALEDSLAEIR